MFVLAGRAKSEGLSCAYFVGQNVKSISNSSNHETNNMVKSRQSVQKCNKSNPYCYTAWIEVNGTVLKQSQGKYFSILTW